jgi:tetratricopeptide (TPR) repeat protein
MKHTGLSFNSHIFLFSGLMIILLFTPVILKSQIKYQHFLFAGQNDLQKERYIDAIKKFNTAIYSKPDAFEAYFLRGIAKFSLGDFQGAINDFSTTISFHPLYVRAYHYRGISRDRENDFAHAISDFNKALEIDPFNPDVYMARGDTKMHLHDYHGAIEDYSSALNLEHNIAAAYLNRGVANYFIEEHELALEDLNKAIFLDYFNVEVWSKRGMIRYELDSLEVALEDYNHAISLDDESPFVYFQRALTYFKLGDTIATLNDYNKVIDLDPDNALTFYNRALLKSMTKDYKSAIEDYTSVIEINPYNIYAYFNRGIVYAELNKNSFAENDFTTAIEIFPDFVGAYINRSYVREKKKDRRGAMEDHDMAMKIIEMVDSDKISPEVLYKRYADSAYFSKIIEFEADFVSGDMKKGRVQFQRVSIEPKDNFFLVYAFTLPDSLYMKYQKYEYFDKNISQFNANNKFGLRFVFTTRDWPVSREKALDELQRIDSTILIAGDTAGAYFLKGTVNSMLQNYSIAISSYDEAIKRDKKISYAYLNRGTTRFELDEFIYSERQYSDAITISRNAFDKKEQKQIDPPDHTSTLQDYDKVIEMNSRLPFVYYNRANVKLQLKEFHRAIDDYSMAIKIEPELAEAYFNRALTLLFLKENKLACKDLSKAGELGIKESYNIIKRYCN